MCLTILEIKALSFNIIIPLDFCYNFNHLFSTNFPFLTMFHFKIIILLISYFTHLDPLFEARDLHRSSFDGLVPHKAYMKKVHCCLILFFQCRLHKNLHLQAISVSKSKSNLIFSNMIIIGNVVPKLFLCKRFWGSLAGKDLEFIASFCLRYFFIINLFANPASLCFALMNPSPSLSKLNIRN